MRCPMCGDVGWVLDANGAGLTPPLSLELVPCFFPACTADAPPIATLSFKFVRFANVATHPTRGFVMSVSA